MRFFALGYVMENHTINKCEKEQRFLEIEENKSCIINPMGVCGFHGVLLLFWWFFWWDVFDQVMQTAF